MTDPRPGVRRRLLGASLVAPVATAIVVPRPAVAQAPAARVISAGGGLTEIVFAIGAADRLVGTDTTSTHPAAARDLPKVGYLRSLSAEGLLSLRPALVLAGHEAGPAVVLAQLEAAGVRVLRFAERHDLDGLTARIVRIGDALDVRAAADTLAERIASDWRRTRAVVQALRDSAQAPRAIFVLAHGGAPMVSGAATAAHAMLTLAGAENPLRSAFDGYRPMTPEALLLARPDAIVTTTEGLRASGGLDGLLARPGVAATPAGRARRVVDLDALLMLGFGPRMPEAVERLARGVFGRSA